MDFSRVGWIVTGDRPEAIASYRYAAFIPAAELGSPVWRCDPGDDPDALLDRHRPSALVLGKAFHAGFVALAQAAKARGLPVLAAMCDWHFDNPLNIALAKGTDRVVVQTAAMAAAVRQHFGVDPAVIEEPYEGPRGTPRFAPNRPTRLLWFGHSANLDTLAAGINQVGARAGLDFLVYVVTNRPERVPEVLSGQPRPQARIRLEVRNWSLAMQWQQLAECHAVLLPSLPRDDKAVKGHNRLVQAIHAGRLALAYPLPQYRELSSYCWCGEDLGEGLAWALAHPAEVEARLVAGQAAIDARFSPARIAARWKEEIARLEPFSSTQLHK